MSKIQKGYNMDSVSFDINGNEEAPNWKKKGEDYLSNINYDEVKRFL